MLYVDTVLESLFSSITLPLISPSPCLSPPTSTSVFLCCSVAGITAPRDIDWAQLNSARLMGDMWFTNVSLALILQLHTRTNRVAHAYIFTYCLSSKHILYTHKWTHHALMHKKQIHISTLKWIPYKCMTVHTNSHTPLGVPPDTLNLSQLKPRRLHLLVRRAGTVHSRV